MQTFRIALLADIHGNRPAYRAVLAHMQASSPDALIVAGDIIGGPHDEEILAHLRQSGAPYSVYIVRGNAEDYITRIDDGSAPPEWLSLKQYAMVRWISERLSPAVRAQLHALPARMSITLPGAGPLLVFHGTPNCANEHLSPDLNSPTLVQAFSTTSETVLICGHSHKPWTTAHDGRMAVSPGAVCAPLDGQTGAQYAMLEWDGRAWSVDHRCIPYSFDAFKRDAQQSGMLDTGYLARAHLASITNGSDWGNRLLYHARLLSEQAGIHLPYIPDEIWEQAGRTFFEGKNDGKFSV